MQPLTYTYNSKVHCASNLPPFSVILSGYLPDPTTFNYLTALPTEDRPATSQHVLRAQLLQPFSAKWQDGNRRMNTAQHRYNGDHYRQVQNAPRKTEVKQYMYLDRSLMIASLAERLATKSYRNLLSAKTGPFLVFEVMPPTVTISQDGICHTVSVDEATGAPTVKKTPTENSRTQTNVR